MHVVQLSTYHKKLSQDESGFTIVEIMVSLAILGIAIIAIMSLLTTNAMMAARAADKSRITDAMSELAEKLRSMPYKDAGIDKTYVTDDDIVMNLSVENYNQDNADVKIITINGYSTKMTPRNTQNLEVVLRNPALGTNEDSNEGDPVISNPPVIVSFTMFKNDFLQNSGPTIFGDVAISYSVAAKNPSATLTSVRIMCNGEPIVEQLAPNNYQTYSALWASNAVDTNNARLFNEGIGKLTVEVKDNQGGYTTQTIPIVVDNVPVTTTFPSSTVSISKTNGIQVSWNTIPDPDGGSSGALRYKVRLETYKKATLLSTDEQIISGATVGQLPPTTALFSNYYSPSQNYKVYVYPMCPLNCGHTSSQQISSKYLYKEF